MENRFKRLLQIALAGQSFKESGAMIEHILYNSLDSEQCLYSSCVAGAVICYCCPFMEAKGLGSLQKQIFEDFSDSKSPADYSSMHLQLVIARNKLCAHFDLEYGEAEFRAQRYKEHPCEIVLWLRPDGFSIRTTHTDLSPKRLELAKKVIEFQLAKIDKQSSAIINSMRNQPGIKDGFHIFRPDGLSN